MLEVRVLLEDHDSMRRRQSLNELPRDHPSDVGGSNHDAVEGGRGERRHEIGMKAAGDARKEGSLERSI